jgi:flavin reductase (DIM6/NTAB) family NADH-FMN oxidoreductase RutF
VIPAGPTREEKGVEVNRSDSRTALGRIPYGLYIVGSVNGDRIATIVANWVLQVSFHPQLVAVSIEQESHMRRHIDASGVFSVNILPAGGKDIAQAFLKSTEPVASQIHGREFRRALHGSPFLLDALACIECRVVRRVDAGDHFLFVGEVVDAAAHHEGEALTLRETGWSYQK